ncbi:hypothetical protein [Paraburkholderia phosphatilytica]|uniref:hypothetical protein n=1 Tax=Paraburkholderia phosphatilytica TaxID=2282883 RepID=UPI0013DEC3A9|nr:hypothetical protein [Paraburkholderia phosphatilytica]
MTDANEIKFTSKDSAIEKWVARFRDEKLEETAQETLKKTSFDGARGQIAVIGLKFGAGESRAIWSPSWNEDFGEGLVLREAFDAIESAFSACNMRQPVFIGHYISGFDLPFLFKRAVILGVEPPAILLHAMRAKPWDDCLFDTMKRWDAQNNIKLDALCAALGVQGKTEGMDGSQVWEYIRTGRIAEVAAYCMDDTDAAYRAYRRMSFLPIEEPAMELEPDFAF